MGLSPALVRIFKCYLYDAHDMTAILMVSELSARLKSRVAADKKTKTPDFFCNF